MKGEPTETVGLTFMEITESELTAREPAKKTQVFCMCVTAAQLNLIVGLLAAGSGLIPGA